MTKEEIVRLFIDLCHDPKHQDMRMLSCQGQQQQNIWQIFEREKGLVQIKDKGENIYSIKFYTIVGTINKNDVYEFELTSEEYHKLKNEYFRGYHPILSYEEGISRLRHRIFY